MFSIEIKVNHTDGDRVSYTKNYNISETFESIELALKYKNALASTYKELKKLREVKEINKKFSLPTYIDGLYDSIISVKIVLANDFKEKLD